MDRTSLFACWTFCVVSLFSFAHISSLGANRLEHKCWKGIYVSGLVWNHLQDWEVYINGVRFDPHKKRRRNLIVQNITEEGVYLRYRLDKGWKEVYLEPHQSYDIYKHKRHWGDCRMDGK